MQLRKYCQYLNLAFAYKLFQKFDQMRALDKTSDTSDFALSQQR